MRRLLIADAAGELAKSIVKQLDNFYHIAVCHRGEKLLRQICDFDPDILFLDMSIPGPDCFGILETMVSTSRQTAVVVLVNMASDYTLARLERLGIKCVLTKPCKINCAVSHIRQIDFLQQHPDMIGWNLEHETEKILMDLGFYIGKPRYYALCRAITYKYANRDSQMKQVYYAVADVQGTTVTQVEKAIRDAIIDGYKCGDPNLWRMYFHPRRNSKASYPTNEEFIARIVECLYHRTRLKAPYIAKAE